MVRRMEGEMINDTNLKTISKSDLESYAREAKEHAAAVTNFIRKQRMHIAAAYLLFDFLKKDIEKNFPEVKGLLND